MLSAHDCILYYYTNQKQLPKATSNKKAHFLKDTDNASQTENKTANVPALMNP